MRQRSGTRQLICRLLMHRALRGAALVATVVPVAAAQTVGRLPMHPRIGDTTSQPLSSGVLTDSLDPIAAATRDYRASGAARSVVRGSVVIFPYGHSQPTVSCAVLRACIVELQAGEVVLSRIAGDTERWEITTSATGADGRTPLIVVKPRDCDLTTNLVLATDRRLYDLTLDAPPCRVASSGKPGNSSLLTNPQHAYARHVRFYYPDETVTEWGATPRGRPASDPASFNFHYEVRRDRRFPWALAQVFDDGARVYIKLPEEARHASAPVLFVLEADGSRSLLNYNVVNGDTYVTDRTFERAVLVLGDAGSERKAVIERKGGGVP
ncbi:MAG: hypothetical protein NVS4B3_04740 [Gemmatimonadaceae bacterium]